MTAPLHTPGPWAVRTLENFGFNVVHYVDGDKFNIARVAKTANEHDVRLIAAAPDLLAAHLAWEAAEDARNDCTDYDDGCDNEGPWEQCPLCSARFGEAIDLRHAAIAKARGGAA